MYSPKEFQIDDDAEIEAFLESYPLATVVASLEGINEITHLPIQRLSDGKYYGHISVENKLSKARLDDKISLIFTGPHSYISPLMYESDFNVPTWNYSAVHCHGRIHFIDNKKVVWKLFQELVELNEGPNGWKLPNDMNYQKLLDYIKFFRFEMLSREAKYKFSQNKSDKDQLSAIKNLEKSGDTENASFMREVSQLD